MPSQERFHRSRARFKGYSGSIGCGKSQALCHEALRLSYVNAGRTGLVGAPTYPMLRDATLMSLVEVLEANELSYELNKADFVLTMLDTGSKILLRSVSEYERLRGTNLAWFGIDELSYAEEAAWLRLEGRLRDPLAKELCGFAVWTPKGYDWVYKRFIATGSNAYDVIRARPFENKHILDVTPDYYDRLKVSYDESFYKQEVLGEYLNSRGGRVYHQFDRDVHVRDIPVHSHLPILWALDFNVNPMCSVVAQVEGDTVCVLDEIVIERATTMDACEELQKRYPAHRGGLVVYGDASGESMKTSGSSDYELVRQHFRRSVYRDVRYKVPSRNPAVRDRVQVMNAKLRDAIGESHMRISPRCTELIKDLEEVVYKSDTTVIEKDRDPKRTHLSDALGYLVWQECRPQPTFGERNQRLL